MVPARLRPAASVEEVLDLLAAGAGRFDLDGPDADPVDNLEHQLQCAAELARVAPDDLELQVAGLVHDVGHQLRPGCLDEHGDVAADYVAPLLGPRVAALVALHVPAKRYLVSIDPTYAARLSRGSTASLAVQGGALSDAERARLEDHPDLEAALVLRRADEAAKQPEVVSPPLDRWRPALEAVATARR